MHRQYTVANFLDENVLGHAIKYISRLISNFFTLLNCSIAVKVTNTRVNRGGDCGPQIPVTYPIHCPQKAIELIESHILEGLEDASIKALC